VNRYLVRQALLHVALAVLAPVPRQGTLEIHLERRDGVARLWMAGSGAAGTSETPETGAPGDEPDFALRFSPGGTLAQLHVARALLATQGGELRPVSGGSGGAMPSYEIEWKIPDTVSDKE
jgi:hypothetical protein